MQRKWKSWLCKKNVKNDEMKGKIGKWEGSGKNCTEGRESSKKSEEREGMIWERLQQEGLSKMPFFFKLKF